MCGRFTLTKPRSLLAVDALADLLPPGAVALLEQLEPRFNIAPSQDVLALANTDERMPQLMRWGLIPSWAKDDKIGYRTINARAESVATKPAFRAAFSKRRCLVLADGFYEWKAEGKRKQPFYIRRLDGQPFAFAGLWERWQPPDRQRGEVRSCTIITTTPNALLAPIHDRMPVILAAGAYEAWLDPEAPSDKTRLGQLLLPCAAEALEAFPVSRLVNNVREDQPDCIRPLEDPPAGEPDGQGEGDEEGEQPRRRPVQRSLFD